MSNNSPAQNLTFHNFQKKLDTIVRNFRKKELSKSNPIRRTKKLTHSVDYLHSHPKQIVYSNLFLSKNNELLKTNSVINKRESLELEYNDSFKESEGLSMAVAELMENGSKNNELEKYKEIVYKLQLRDAVHRQEIKKLSEKNLELEKKLKKKEEKEKINKDYLMIEKQLEIEKEKVKTLENKIERINPVQTAKLLEKLNNHNEELEKENNKLEEIIKQFLLDREIEKVRIMYSASKTTASPNISPKNDFSGKKNENYNSNYVKNIELDLNQLIKNGENLKC